VQAAIAKRELYSQVSSLAQLAKAEPRSRLHRQPFKKYLDIKNPGGTEYSIQIRQGRLRVHSDEAMQNKIFVGFIALILLSHIHNVMLDQNRTFTLK